MKKLSTIAIAPTLLFLTACGGAQEPATTTETTTQTATETTVVQPDTPAQDAPQRELPSAVSGYTEKAEAELIDEGVTKDDVDRVLTAALNNDPGVEIEWDDDGYWEIELGAIDIDIDPNGLVVDVDRDD
ncbi:hypothetical protein QP994_06670 [Corynebacterium sp. MSK044]|uniref:hypothetical protein n=1 Tax=unclassified Corynebacterium TaxID=2624378 RepID=UPI00254E8106|nr:MULTISPECIES: hypothetical protein [unclassified Corynebacterium]MDK8795702.1 hypothetical protein [Corynebacterium sp. MSK041]MDK8797567.1 hypothetical protein [Corynebacterium sp. MSK044]